MDILIKKTNIHSKKLFEEIDKNIQDIAAIMLNISKDIESVSEIISLLMIDLAESHQISQINTICNHRNNSRSDLDNGIVHIDIYYKHMNCFNTTHISYTLTEDNTWPPLF